MGQNLPTSVQMGEADTRSRELSFKKKRDILKKNFKGLSGSVLEEWKEWGIGSERWTYWQYGNRTSGDSGQLEGLELLGGLRQTGM